LAVGGVLFLVGCKKMPNNAYLCHKKQATHTFIALNNSVFYK
jgi:hypothetical protein